MLRYMSLSGLDGPVRDPARLKMLGACLEGDALTWYNAVIEPMYAGTFIPRQRWRFNEAVWELYRHFVHDHALNNATRDFEHASWQNSAGINGLYHELLRSAARMLRPPSNWEFTRRMLNVMPADMRKWLIQDKRITPEFISKRRLLKLCTRFERDQLLAKHYQDEATDSRKASSGHATKTAAVPSAAATTSGSSIPTRTRYIRLRPISTNTRAMRTDNRTETTPPRPPTPHRPNPSGSGPGPVVRDAKNIRCYNCGTVGHFARDCRKPKESHRNMEFETVPGIVNEGPPSDEDVMELNIVDDRSDGETSEGEELEYVDESDYGVENEPDTEHQRAMRIMIDPSDELPLEIARKVVEEHFEQRIRSRLSWIIHLDGYLGPETTPQNDRFTEDLQERHRNSQAITWEHLFPEFHETLAPEGLEGLYYWDHIDTADYFERYGITPLSENAELTSDRCVIDSPIQTPREGDQFRERRSYAIENAANITAAMDLDLIAMAIAMAPEVYEDDPGYPDLYLDPDEYYDGVDDWDEPDYIPLPDSGSESDSIPEENLPYWTMDGGRVYPNVSPWETPNDDNVDNKLHPVDDHEIPIVVLHPPIAEAEDTEASYADDDGPFWGEAGDFNVSDTDIPNLYGMWIVDAASNISESLAKVHLHRIRVSSEKIDRPIRTADQTRCLTLMMEINGLMAYTLVDSGSTTTALSPEFSRVSKLKAYELRSPLNVQLGTVGSRSKINYGTYTSTKLGGETTKEYFDIFNIDRYDAVVGCAFMRTHKMALDFEYNVVRVRGRKIETMSLKDDILEQARCSAARIADRLSKDRGST
ncbi:hypothetical protein C8J56DRAFT_1068230 [Mycena floridula]|nr:hypothetical protein C8J56DRAFT_1068230 [Mycena floridula]